MTRDRETYFEPGLCPGILNLKFQNTTGRRQELSPELWNTMSFDNQHI